MAAKVIGIAIVEENGRYLVGTRAPHQDLAGAAEFPGGKCLPGELPEDCAIRECEEETGLRVVAVRLLHRVEFTYPHAVVDLHFWLCRPMLNQHTPQHGFQWVDRDALSSLPFPAANSDIVRMLVARAETPN